MFGSDYLVLKMLSVPAILLALILHECAHGYTAKLLGDPTAERLGRLTLNPLAHLDPIGAILMFLVGFGWAKPVPVDMRNFRNPRRGMALTALMGPVTNFLLAVISAFLFLLTERAWWGLASDPGAVPFATSFAYYLALFFYLLHSLNLSLCLFNLIPLPPLDGSRILGLFLPERWYWALMERERLLSRVFFFWLLIGDSVCDYMLRLPAVAASHTLTVLVKIFSFSGWLGEAVGGLSDLILGLFEKIPFFVF